MKRRKQTGQGPWDPMIDRAMFPRFSFCLIYPRLGTEKTSNPEIQTGADEEKP